MHDTGDGAPKKSVEDERQLTNGQNDGFLAAGSSSWTALLPKTDHVRFALENAPQSLGPVSEWSSALRFYTAMLFADSRPACLYWGPERIAIYNERFCEPCGEAHPKLMGKPLKSGFPSVWEDVRSIFDQAAATGETQDVDRIPLSPVRRGFVEETYFTAQFIQLRGDGGEIDGCYNALLESTTQVLHERARKVVEGLAAIQPCPIDDTLTRVAEVLQFNPHDIPMAMIYSIEELAAAGSGKIRLRSSLGIPHGLPCAPPTADLTVDDAGILQYLRQVKETGTPVVLSQSDGSLQATGYLFEKVEWAGYGEPSREVVIHPLSNGAKLLGFYVQGTNPRRPYDLVTQMSVVDITRQIEAKWAASISHEEAKTRQELLERRLTDSERRLRQMAQSAPLGMAQVIPDGGGTIEWANDQFYEITGHTRTKPAIADFLKIIAPEDRERAQKNLAVLVDRETPRIESELRLTRKWTPPVEEDGDLVDNSAWILTIAFPVFENGKLKLIMGYLWDISHQKWAESIQTRNATAATNAKRRQEEFIDVTSHEMRNPLTAIVQLADGISMSLSDSEDSTSTRESYKGTAESNIESANTILACASHLQRVIDDVLMLSRLESSMLSITPVSARPVQVVANTVKMFDGEVALHGTEIEVVKDVSYNSLEIDYVLCDTSRLAQVLINLISNAIKFTAMRPERKISIAYGAQGKWPPSISTSFGDLEWMAQKPKKQENPLLPVLGEEEDTLYLYFSVQDTGPGVTKAEMEKLFKRFSQANSRTHIAYGGSGLGLYICRELAEKQGGGVGVASSPNEGSVFGFYIESRRSQAPEKSQDTRTQLLKKPQLLSTDRPNAPQRRGSRQVSQVANGHPKSPSKAAEAEPEPSPQESEEGIFHVLLVEDNLINQRVLAKQLKAAKCTVTVANNGEEALKVLEKTDDWNRQNDEFTSDYAIMDVILMDWEMPVMDGLTCSKRIRQLEQEGHLMRRLPIIAITANVREEQMSQALDAGMESVVTKPFTVTDLLKRIQETVDKGTVNLPTRERSDVPP